MIYNVLQYTVCMQGQKFLRKSGEALKWMVALANQNGGTFLLEGRQKLLDKVQNRIESEVSGTLSFKSRVTEFEGLGRAFQIEVSEALKKPVLFCGRVYVLVDDEPCVAGSDQIRALILSKQDSTSNNRTEVQRLLSVLKEPMTRRTLQGLLGLKDDDHFRENFLRPAMEQGLVVMAIPDRPRSRFQKYLLTAAGEALRKNHS